MSTHFFDFDLIVPRSPQLPEKIVKGNNRKGLLVVYTPSTQYEDLQSFLEKVLQAVGYQLYEDTASIQVTSDQKLSLTQVLRVHSCAHVLLFGLSPQNLGIHLELPKYVPVRHGVQHYMLADDLEAIYEERQKGGKKMSAALWNMLKQMFTT